MITATKKQKQIIAILTKNDKDLKRDLVIQQTKDKSKSSTNNLSFDQANSIIEQLGGKPVMYDNWAYFDKEKSSHLQIISYAIQFGYSKPHDRYGEVADLERLSEWLKNNAPVKKPLLEMQPKEISKTIVALENMVYKIHIKQSKRNG